MAKNPFNYPYPVYKVSDLKKRFINENRHKDKMRILFPIETMNDDDILYVGGRYDQISEISYAVSYKRLVKIDGKNLRKLSDKYDEDGKTLFREILAATENRGPKHFEGYEEVMFEEIDSGKKRKFFWLQDDGCGYYPTAYTFIRENYYGLICRDRYFNNSYDDALNKIYYFKVDYCYENIEEFNEILRQSSSKGLFGVFKGLFS